MTIAQQLEIDKLKEQIKIIQEDKFIEPFVASMLNKIGILLTDERFDAWPDLCKIAFSSAAREYPGSSKLYLDRIKS